jgi:ABC-2 type transport system permease protein
MRGLIAVYAIWLRDCKVFLREPSRVVGSLAQPLLYLLIVGQGIASSLSLNQAPGRVGYLQFMYPGILGMSVLFTSIFSAISIIWDREFGLLKEVLVAPVPRWGVALGKVLGGATVALAQAAILIALGPVVGVTLSVGLVVQLLLICFLMSVAVTALGVCIAAGMRSMQGFQMVMNFLVMPLYFLSGAMFPISSAPGWMRALMVLDPLSYGVDALRNVVFASTQTGAGSLEAVAQAAGLVRWDLASDLALLAVVAAVLAAASAVRFSLAD